MSGLLTRPRGAKQARWYRGPGLIPGSSSCVGYTLRRDMSEQAQYPLHREGAVQASPEFPKLEEEVLA